ncbi:MAG: SpoIIE family protein phosphatase [Sulfuritalea sp.]|nr:SpoIIE family protein phosphatase [Sulfuritalea sp.]
MRRAACSKSERRQSPALLLDAEGRVSRRIDSMQMALGLNDDNPALFETQRVACDPGGHLLLCSDGIWEAGPCVSGHAPGPGRPLSVAHSAPPAPRRAWRP